MAKDFIKFIQKHPQRERLLDILEDIYHDDVSQYDIKPLQGHTSIYRIRIGKIRIIFEKTTDGNKIHHIGNRGDAYKGL